MAKKLFPEQAECISMAMTPMVLTARLIKKERPNARICFVGPCAAKKLEASRRSVRSEVDFVLTFEELMGLFEAKSVDFAPCLTTRQTLQQCQCRCPRLCCLRRRCAGRCERHQKDGSRP